MVTGSTTPTWSQFAGTDPQRQPAWRWLLAQYMVAAHHRITPADDRSVAQLVRWLKGGCLETNAGQKHMWEARRLHERESDISDEVRARLLALQTPEEIARQTKLNASLVRSFKIGFFDVGDGPVIGEWVRRAVGYYDLHLLPRTRARVWNFAAMSFGPVAADAVIAFDTGGPSTAAPGTADIVARVRHAYDAHVGRLKVQSDLRNALHAYCPSTRRMQVGPSGDKPLALTTTVMEPAGI